MNRSAEDRGLRHREVETTPLSIASVVLLGLTLVVVTESVPSEFVFVVIPLAVFVLLTHSIGIDVDDEAVTVRLGNGMLRQRIALAEILAVETEDHGVHGLGFPRDGARRFGLGGHCLRIEHGGGITECGLRAATEVAAAIERARQRSSENSEGDA